MKCANISPLLVAEALLNKAAERGKSLTTLQLIKMVYLAQGWSLGAENMALFHEDVEAWKYGPVIPSVYYAYRQFGKSPIPASGIKTSTVDGDSDNNIGGEHGKLLTDIVDFVLDVYGDFTGGQLSNLTHQEDSPWSEIYDGSRRKPIDKPLIKSHFEQLAQEYAN